MNPNSNPLTEKEKMLAGELYSPIDPQLIGERAHARDLLKRFNIGEYALSQKAQLFLRTLLPNAASDLIIEAPFFCDYGYNIHCGKRVFFNSNCIVLDVMKVVIGSYVLIGPGVHIYTATHPMDAKTRRSEMFGRPVTIGDDCWIGGGAIICPGVSIGKGSVVGAGSIVTRDVAPGTFVAGNPARLVRKL